LDTQPQNGQVEEGNPRLPLGSTWEDLDFSLETVLAPWVRLPNHLSGVNLRIWIMRALDRYRFVLGDARTEFIRIQDVVNLPIRRRSTPLSPRVIVKGSSTVENNVDPRPIAMVCANDDFKLVPPYLPGVFLRWARNLWPNRLAWEREG